MVEPQSFYYGKCKVYNLDDLIQFDKAYFYTKRNISVDDYHNAPPENNDFLNHKKWFKKFKVKYIQVLLILNLKMVQYHLI
jgi:hypothetical protein